MFGTWFGTFVFERGCRFGRLDCYILIHSGDRMEKISNYRDFSSTEVIGLRCICGERWEAVSGDDLRLRVVEMFLSSFQIMRSHGYLITRRQTQHRTEGTSKGSKHEQDCKSKDQGTRKPGQGAWGKSLGRPQNALLPVSPQGSRLGGGAPIHNEKRGAAQNEGQSRRRECLLDG